MAKAFKPGITFGDFVIQDAMSRKSRIPSDREVDYRRGWLIWLVIVIIFSGLAVRASMLQLFLGERYRVLANQNRIRKIKLPAPRGIIYDRNGTELAGNEKVRKQDAWSKVPLEMWRRQYFDGRENAPVVGYVGEIGAEEVGLLKTDESPKPTKTEADMYDSGDKVGRSGIEAQYEDLLRGTDGGRLVEVDNQGEIVREMGRKEAAAGQDLHLTIDSQLQKTAFAAMNGKKGAVVVSNPKTGEVLALVSSPSYDPNSISEKYSEISGDKDLPMFNRSIGAVYPPGSTFKMITTTAALESGKVPVQFTFKDEGIIRVGAYSYSNWLFSKRGATEGIIGFEQAIKKSTDTFFYKVGEMTTPEIIGQWAKQYGLAAKTGIDLPGEVTGLIPGPQWKEATTGEKWFLGNTYHMAIGQGDVLATPIQINQMTNILASGGKKCKPHLVMAINNKLQFVNNEQCANVQISDQTLKIIKAGMVGACTPGGTAFPLFDFKPQAACKTGTAEYWDNTAGKMKSHGWLTAYAPADDPQISVTVVMEGGGEGSNVAAPVVRKVLAKYFKVEDHYDYAAIPQEVGE